MSRVLKIREAQDISNILSSYRIVVIDSYADWCYPCKMMEPKYEELAARYSSSDVCFSKCNAELELIQVKGLPSIDIYVNGALYTNILGADVKRLEETLKQLVPQQPQQPQQPQGQHPQQPQQSQQGYKSKNSGSTYKSYGSYWG